MALAMAPAIVPSPSRSQTRLPDKAIRMLVGFSAGGGTDLLARLVAQRLEARTGRHITVENRPGGTGAVVGELLKKAPPDGSLLGFIPSTTLASKLAVTSFPFDPVKDVTPVSLVGTFQMAIAAAPQLGVATFTEYVQWLKDDEPGRRRLGTASSDTFLQLFGMLFGRAAGVPIENVPYRGAAPLIVDLREGRIPAAFSGVPSLLPHHRGGRIRILETPGPIVTEWSRQIGAELDRSETRAELATLGLEVESSTPEELAARVALNLDQWSRRMALVGMKTAD